MDFVSNFSVLLSSEVNFPFWAFPFSTFFSLFNFLYLKPVPYHLSRPLKLKLTDRQKDFHSHRQRDRQTFFRVPLTSLLLNLAIKYKTKNTEKKIGGGNDWLSIIKPQKSGGQKSQFNFSAVESTIFCNIFPRVNLSQI